MNDKEIFNKYVTDFLRDLIEKIENGKLDCISFSESTKEYKLTRFNAVHEIPTLLKKINRTNSNGVAVDIFYEG